MADFRLETDRLILRDWRAEDWPRFWALTNTPAVMRWLGGLASAETMREAQGRLEGYARDYGHTFWVVERKDDGGHLAGELLGFCGLKRAAAPNSTIEGEFEIGWRLREDAWGQGYAKGAESHRWVQHSAIWVHPRSTRSPSPKISEAGA